MRKRKSSDLNSSLNGLNDNEDRFTSQQHCETSEAITNLKEQLQLCETTSHNVILEQDRFLPIANINRIMKSVIPKEGKLSKEAKECVQECITEFLLFITSEASERCAMEKRKTITGEDLLVAFQTLGFDDYVEPLREFLQKYRDANKVQSNSKSDEVMDVDYGNPTVIFGSDTLTSTSQPFQLSETAEQFNTSTITIASNSNTKNKIEQISPQSVTQDRPILVPNTLQPMSMFYDPSTGQHYVTVQGTDGTQSLLPVHLTPATQSTAPPIIQVANVSGNNLPQPTTQPAATTANNKPTTTQRKGRHLANTSIENVSDGEQTVRHYLQSQEFKLRKASKN